MCCALLFLQGASSVQVGYDSTRVSQMPDDLPSFDWFRSSNCFGYNADGITVDLPDNFPSDDASTCAASCLDNPECGSFVFCNNSASQCTYDMSMCWLKRQGEIIVGKQSADGNPITIEDCLKQEAGSHPGHTAGVKKAASSTTGTTTTTTTTSSTTTTTTTTPASASRSYSKSSGLCVSALSDIGYCFYDSDSKVPLSNSKDGYSRFMPHVPRDAAEEVCGPVCDSCNGCMGFYWNAPGKMQPGRWDFPGACGFRTNPMCARVIATDRYDIYTAA